MAYIGKEPGSGLRGRFIYTATAGQTSFTGADSLGRTLTYTDGEYTDVFLNGVKLDKTDYTATSGTSIVLDSGASADDTLEILAFDTFGLFSGEFAQDVSVGGDLTVDTSTLKVDSANNRVGVGTTSPETPIEIETTNKLGGTFTGTTDGEGLRVTQTDYTSGNYVSLVEAPYDDSNSSANVRIAAMFDGGGSHIAFGTSNSYGAGITNTAMFIDQVGFVGVGNTAPDTSLDVSGNGVPFEVDSTNSNTYKVQFKNNGTVTSYFGTAADSFFFANSSATQLARIDSDGIKFGTDSAAANGLGDYEEGTWTPTYIPGGGTLSITYDIQVGIYRKVGGLVHAAFVLRSDAASGGSGSLFISGLPFAGSTTTNAFYSGSIGYVANFSSVAPQAIHIGSNGTTIVLITHSSSDGRGSLSTQVSTSNLSNSTNSNFIVGQMTYPTDA